MTFEMAWSGPLSPPDSILGPCASRVARAPWCRPEAVWLRALRLVESVSHMWRPARDVSAATSAQTTSELLQRTSLSPPCTAEGLDVAVRYQAAQPEAQIGGDWYDSFVDGSGATLLTVGDVSGHDHRASATMGHVLTLFRGLAIDTDDAPSRLLSRLDEAMAGLQLETLATAVVARVEPPTRRSTQQLRWSSAGHLPPLLRDPDGVVTRLEAEPDLLLGLSPDTPRFDHAIDLEGGSTLLLYTDGLVERRDGDLDDGIENLATVLSNLGDLDVGSLCDAILESTAAPEAGDDDIALLVLRSTG
jgi:serine phosphatase RsbU (regulator of sigma subunit)